VGLATAYLHSARHPGRSVVLLEKERELASHQSGHNSGVLHAGIYYAPGSLKARGCRRGKALLEDFCRRAGVPFRTCGKLVVATREPQLPRLAALAERATANGVEAQRVEAKELARLQPGVGGLAGLFVPSTGIVDFRAVARALAEQAQAAGVEIRRGERVVELADEGDACRVVTDSGETWRARRAYVCGGLQADRLARAAGLEPGIRIVPFLGEYRRLAAARAGGLERLVYPVPDPGLPFLGVHLTPRIDGSVECGPNALPTLAREGYARLAFDWRDAAETLAWPGTWRLGARLFPTAAGELRRSFSRRAFARALSELWPEIREEWLQAGTLGVRAQAVDRAGRLMDDFHLLRRGNLHFLLNAPSPAATACLAIAETLLDEASGPVHDLPATGGAPLREASLD